MSGDILPLSIHLRGVLLNEQGQPYTSPIVSYTGLNGGMTLNVEL
jgi:hypothetical protein